MRTKNVWPVLVLFFCSGATALIYEVVWSKYLAQMFGSTIYAQTMVLAVFMGGLALGNRWFGGRADRLARPVRAYGLVEVAIGLYAFFFPNIFAAADKIFVAIGSAVLERSLVLLGIKGLISLLLLIVPTVLMGGTLPLLAAFLQRTSLEAGRKSARFYSVNSLGAVVGSAVAGFYLVQNWGMVASLQLTALLNLCIAGAAILLSRSLEPEIRSLPGTQPTGHSEPLLNEAAALSETPSANDMSVKWAGLLVALTGGISMGLEVLASRSMALIFGSSLQSFAMVLISFILGIGLGSAAIASTRWQRCNSTKALTILLMAAALWIGLLVFRIESWVEIYRVLRTGLARSSMGYCFHQLLAAGLAMIVLGVPAAMIGAVLPLLIRGAAETASKLGRDVGRLLTWNTIGAVIGVLLTGFVIMPRLGLRNAFLFLALGLAVTGMMASWRQRLLLLVRSSVGVSAVLVALMFIGNEGWRHVMSSGVFRARETEVNPEALRLRKQHVRIHFYEDAPDATVDVEQGDGVGAPPDLGLRLNGKADASTRIDLCTQLLLGHIPMAACPDAKEIFILGLGSGITGGAILGHPIEHLTIAENCEPVLRAAKYFEAWNRGVLTNRVTKIWIEDARTILKLSPKKYDLIITQPSNPWMVGVGSVFSREYYELGASRLKAGGVMAQWFHVYDMHDGMVNLVLRTFGSVFPQMEIWDSGSGDLILLGSLEPWASNPSIYRRVFERPVPQKDFEMIGITSPEALWARQLASQRTAFAIADSGPVQSDLFPVLEYEAPRAFYIGAKAKDLGRFDERTCQLELSPLEKRRALEAMDEKTVQRVFSDYSTINEELGSFLAWRFHNSTGAAEYRPSWPCVFKRAGQSATVEPPSGLNDEATKLLAAVSKMQRNGAERIEGIDTVSALLDSYGPGSDWSVPHYAALAAKSSIAMCDYKRGIDLVSAALELNPDNPELRYLSRIIERERKASTRAVAFRRGRDAAE